MAAIACGGRKPGRRWATAAIAALLAIPASLHAQPLRITPTWTVQAGSDPIETTAADELRRDLKAHLALELLPSQARESSPSRSIVIGTVDTSPVIAAEQRRRPFRLPAGEPEAYHIAERGGALYIVGASPKGAMNGVFRFLDRQSVDIAGLDESAAPFFKLRVAGHTMNQTPPPDWSEEDQARYYARHFINVVWGEKHGPPLSLAARRKYGLGLMAEVKFPPGGGERLDDPAIASAVYYHKPGEKRRVLDPFDPAGAAVYRDAFRDLLRENPDLRVLYGLFGDYSVIPNENSARVTDGKVYGHKRPDTMKRILALMREAIGERDVVPTAWLWHAFFGDAAAEERFMREIAADGYGILYNEAGNNDNWLLKRDNFSETALKTGPDGAIAWGPRYLPLVSAGGACESVNPVISLPLPRVAAGKIKRLAAAGVRNVALWWGSAEGWTYDSNLEVVKELIWNPEEPVDALLTRISERDFGPKAAPDVRAFWDRFDAALPTNRPLYRRPGSPEYGDPATDGLRLYDWWQRMGIFTESVFGGLFARPLTPADLASVKSVSNTSYWGVDPWTHRNYEAVIAGMADARRHLDAALTKEPTAPARTRIAALRRWSSLYEYLLTSQYNFLRAVAAVQSVVPPDLRGSGEQSPEVRAKVEKLIRSEPAGLRERLAPVTAAEGENTQRLIDLLPEFAQNFNLRQPHLGVVKGQGDRDKEIELLRQKLATMQGYLAAR